MNRMNPNLSRRRAASQGALTLIGAAVLSVAGAALPIVAVAQQAGSNAGNTPAPLRAYLSPPKFRAPTLSPSGRYLAVTSAINGRMNLAVIDLETRKSQAVTSLTTYDVTRFNWIGNERLAFSVGNINAPAGEVETSGGGLFVVSRDGKESRTITPTVREIINSGAMVGRGLSYAGPIPGSDREILAAGNLRAASSIDFYRVDVVTGKQTLLTFDHPGQVQRWLLDVDLVPRIAVVRERDDELEERPLKVLYRSSATAPWEQIAVSARGHGDGEIFSPEHLTPDGKTLYVASNKGRDTTALFKFDLEKKALGEMVAGHPRYDMGADGRGEDTAGLRLSQDRKEVLGYTVDAERSQTSWVDADLARIQAQMEATFRNKDIALQRVSSGRTLVSVSAPDSIPQSFLYDEEKKRLEELFVAKTDLKDSDLVPMRPFLLKTRDGLEIPSYYFLPKDYKPGQKLPTVLHIHGGPMARADFGAYGGGFGWREAQVLASRGYAVVLPNFRITPGFGRKIYEAGFGTIGNKMSEDHEDAVQWAVQQGFADSRRVCITGASYGGYATLQALVKTPDLFACGIAGLVVSDLELQLTSTATDFSGSKSAVAYWRRLIGQNTPGWDKARAVSPGLNTAQIKSPLAMYAGRDDRRTPLEQTERVINDMKRTGKAPEYVFIADKEAHGFGLLDNNLKNYELMLDFLDRHIGSKSRFASETKSGAN